MPIQLPEQRPTRTQRPCKGQRAKAGQILTLEGVEIRSGARQHAPLKGQRQRSEGSGQSQGQAALPAIAPPQFRSGPRGKLQLGPQGQHGSAVIDQGSGEPELHIAEARAPLVHGKGRSPRLRSEKRNGPRGRPIAPSLGKAPKVVPAVDGLIEHAAPARPKGRGEGRRPARGEAPLEAQGACETLSIQAHQSIAPLVGGEIAGPIEGQIGRKRAGGGQHRAGRPRQTEGRAYGRSVPPQHRAKPISTASSRGRSPGNEGPDRKR